MMKKSVLVLLIVISAILSSVTFACAPKKYTVSFEVNGGSSISPVQVEENKKLQKPSDPIKENYMVDGWFTDENFSVQWNFEENTVNSDITLYVKWIRAYRVSFDSCGGMPLDSVIVGDGKKLTPPEHVRKDGYSFLGWYKEPELITEWQFDTDTVIGDITLYAKWEAGVTDIKVAYGSPHKIEFVVGEAFTCEGLVVEKVFGDGSREVMSTSEYTVDSSKFDSSVKGYCEITLIYNANPSTTSRYMVMIKE